MFGCVLRRAFSACLRRVQIEHISCRLRKKTPAQISHSEQCGLAPTLLARRIPIDESGLIAGSTTGGGSISSTDGLRIAVSEPYYRMVGREGIEPSTNGLREAAYFQVTI